MIAFPGALLIVFAVIGLLGALFLLFRGGHAQAIVLSALLVCVSAGMIGTAIIDTGIYLDAPFLLHVGDLFWVLSPLLFFLSVRETMNAGVRTKSLLFYVPVLFCVLIVIWFLLDPVSEKIERADRSIASGISTEMLIFIASFMISTGIYTIVALRIYELWLRNLHDFTANPGRNGRWILTVLRRMMWVLVGVALLLTIATGFFMRGLPVLIIIQLMTGIIFMQWVFHVYRNREMPLPDHQMHVWEDAHQLTNEPYHFPDPSGNEEVPVFPEWQHHWMGERLNPVKDTSCTDADINFDPEPAYMDSERNRRQWEDRFTTLMTDFRPWQNPNFDANMLSSMLGLPRDLLSGLFPGKDAFHTVMNRYRLEHAKKSYLRNTPVNIVAAESGYDNASVMQREFYRIYRISMYTFRKISHRKK